MKVFLLLLFSLSAGATEPSELTRFLVESRAAFTDTAAPSVSAPVFFEMNTAPAPPFRPRSANKCGHEDFREQFGENRNQDGVGWCFANVAADLLSIYSGERLSPFGLAMQFYQSPEGRDQMKVTPLYGGTVTGALEVGVRNGVCSEADLGSADDAASFLMREQMAGGKPMPDLERYSSAIVADSLRVLGDLQGRSLEKILDGTTHGCEEFVEASTMLFPKLDPVDVARGLATTRNYFEALNYLVRSSCGTRRFGPKPGLQFDVFFADRDAQQKPLHQERLLPHLDQAISAKQPAWVVFDPKMLFPRDPNAPDNVTSLHTVLVVGREFRDGECKFLLRNSMGSSCGGYLAPYGDPRNCERGNIWMSESELAASLVEVGTKR